MMKICKLIILASLSLLLSSCTHNTKKGINIAVAANMQFAIKDICSEFTKLTNVKCNIIIGSSGKLTTQIEQGAPYHVFLSADIKYPQYLHQKKITSYKPFTYAYGHLILWSNHNDIDINLKKLNNLNIKHIAMANPKTAPYGFAADQVLNNLKLKDILESQLVYGESVSQVNQFVLSKTAQLGFTSKSVVPYIIKNKTGQWKEVPQEFYTPIKQGAIIINLHDQKLKQSLDFLEFLKSKEVSEILIKYGYTPVTTQS
ncbi:molybdate ABC transporter substrate-binding protein [Wenyingzhuangia sp. IMCC45533]